MAVLSPKGLNRPTGDRCMVVEVCGSQVVSQRSVLTASPLGVPHVICANSEREELDRLAKVRVGAVVSGVVQLGRPRRLQLRYQLELLLAILFPEYPRNNNRYASEYVEDVEDKQ